MNRKLLGMALVATMLTACGGGAEGNEEGSSVSSEPSVSSESIASSLESTTSESAKDSLLWASLDEAIDFYEAVLIESLGEEMANIKFKMEFYDRTKWELIENNGDTIIVSMPNLGRGESRPVAFVKGEKQTEVTFYEYETPYPEQPIAKWIVQNEDFVLLEEVNLHPLAWESLAEAVAFYEAAIDRSIGEWALEFSGRNQLIMRSEAVYVELFKGEETTEVIRYEGPDAYPGTPTSKWLVRNADLVILAEEGTLTEEKAFAMLQAQENFSEDLVLDWSFYHADGKYYELVIASNSLKAQGGSGTVGIYHVYEDGRIVDTYQD